ncbi:hypothetical protein O181_023522 [Austropuccinia psidii MF-1]|uniref:Uncharacterized protein n=1 Tax=Austropuccinia psidii MF-1 TaxID=1389203 RepID=A0A9Q3GY39_9BASI|nr:hypothetical protein [Austropuccinia psidii MF-1]
MSFSNLFNTISIVLLVFSASTGALPLAPQAEGTNLGFSYSGQKCKEACGSQAVLRIKVPVDGSGPNLKPGNHVPKQMDSSIGIKASTDFHTMAGASNLNPNARIHLFRDMVSRF